MAKFTGVLVFLVIVLAVNADDEAKREQELVNKLRQIIMPEVGKRATFRPYTFKPWTYRPWTIRPWTYRPVTLGPVTIPPITRRPPWKWQDILWS